ncbi:hypothetical protein KY339_00535 [Candidatus Woesearchaeota archaeon]|nr:hypothetical protein [Candidatus Woesearchaeota archaeon]
MTKQSQLYYKTEGNKLMVYSSPLNDELEYKCYLPKKEELDFNDITNYLPAGTIIQRVPETALGKNVLGCAYLGMNVIHIREDLRGDAFLEVLYHEARHLLKPGDSERKNRQETKKFFPKEAVYH